MGLKLENIDWGVAYWLEKAVTASGYYPDKDIYLPSDAAGLDTAIGAIIAAKGFYIEVLGTAGYEARTELKVCDLVIQRKGIRPSSSANTAHSNVCFFAFEEEGQPKFTKETLPQTSYDIEYEVRAISDHVETERAASNILMNFFGIGKYRAAIDASTGTRIGLSENMYIKQDGQSTDLSGIDYLEKLWRFTVQHVVITESESTIVPAMEEITINLDGRTRINEQNFTDQINLN